MEIITNGPTLRLVGDFDVRSTGDVREALYDLLGERGDDVVIDLSDVRAVDVTALRVLAVASREASRHGQHMTLRGCGPSVRRMLHISRMIRLLQVERVPAAA